MAAALAGERGGRRPWLPALAFAAFGALNLLMGFRSLGGVALVAAGYFILNGVVSYVTDPQAFDSAPVPAGTVFGHSRLGRSLLV